MVKLEGDEAAMAAKSIYELCDVGHKQNRVPMLCSDKYDVLRALRECLTHEGNDDKLHFVCLALNNLSIPDENKRVMALERGSKTLIANLLSVIASGKKEAYLCCICLMNLSFLESVSPVIGQFSPQKKSILGQPTLPPLENPKSLLRIIQEVLAFAARGTADFRWAFGLLATLARNTDNALLIGQTAIPAVAMENIRLSKVPPSQWQTNSLEDFSLFLILYVAQAFAHQPPSECKTWTGSVNVLIPIMEDPGVQGLKATMTCAFLEVPWSTFPNYGVPAVASISELMNGR